MYHPLDYFAKAHQQELLRAASTSPRSTNPNLSISQRWELLTDHLGDILIKLGERIKGECICPEMSEGRV